MCSTLVASKTQGYGMRPTLVSRAEMSILRSLSTVVELEAQERIQPTPENAGAVWLLEEGLVSLSYNAGGKTSMALLLDPGHLFVVAQEAEKPCSGGCAVALTPARLHCIFQNQIKDLLATSPELGYRIIACSWRRIAHLQWQVAEFMTKSVKERLAILLHKMAIQGAQSGKGDYPELRITHKDLARLVGSSREMVTKVMREFHDAGWVCASRRNIGLIDLRALERS